MKLQLEDGIVEIVTLQHGDLRVTVGGLGQPAASVALTKQEAKVVIAILEAHSEEF